MSIITKLEAENVKRIKAVKIAPSGATVVIGGANDQGKSSCLDAIEMALAGKTSIPSMPLRSGQKKGRIVVETEDLIVKRTFTEAGTQLVVTSKAGLVFPSPQAMLDKLVGTLTFDPLAFSRMKDDERARTLKELVGLDFTSHENQRQAAYDERTMVNREVKSLAQRIEAMPEPKEGLPDEVVKSEDIIESIRKATAHNGQIETAKRLSASLMTDYQNVFTCIAEVKEKLAKYEAEAAHLKNRIESGKKWIADNQPVDLVPFQIQLQDVERTNTGIRLRNELNTLRSEYDSKSKEVERLTGIIESVDQKKADALASAKFPIKGLSFNESGAVTFEGIPWDQLSSSKQLKISVAMGFAMNPKLKVLLIRDGSLLDEGNLKTISDMAEQKEGQVWIERVSTGKEVSVVIADGMVKQEEE